MDMLTVLLVDDERQILEGLKVLIDWESYGFQVIDSTDDGIKAKNIALEKQPDLIITDIRMPGMDGLALIESLYMELENTEFIIISGYSDFSYAKKAITYGVTGYLLKPIDEDELIEYLAKIKERLSFKNDEDGEEPNSKVELNRDTKIDEIKRYINENFKETITLGILASKFFINPYYLSQLFKNETGENFSIYLRKVRMREATRLLTYSNLKIYEIADLVGYNNPRVFSQLFEKCFGLNPSTYRENALNQREVL